MRRGNFDGSADINDKLKLYLTCFPPPPPRNYQCPADLRPFYRELYPEQAFITAFPPSSSKEEEEKETPSDPPPPSSPTTNENQNPPPSSLTNKRKREYNQPHPSLFTYSQRERILSSILLPPPRPHTLSRPPPHPHPPMKILTLLPPPPHPPLPLPHTPALHQSIRIILRSSGTAQQYQTKKRVCSYRLSLLSPFLPAPLFFSSSITPSSLSSPF